jgi:hypothetical protein
LAQRLKAGKLAPAIECRLWHYAKGKPKEPIESDQHITISFSRMRGGTGRRRDFIGDGRHSRARRTRRSHLRVPEGSPTGPNSSAKASLLQPFRKMRPTNAWKRGVTDSICAIAAAGSRRRSSAWMKTSRAAVNSVSDTVFPEGVRRCNLSMVGSSAVRTASIRDCRVPVLALNVANTAAAA